MSNGCNGVKVSCIMFLDNERWHCKRTYSHLTLLVGTLCLSWWWKRNVCFIYLPRGEDVIWYAKWSINKMIRKTKRLKHISFACWRREDREERKLYSRDSIRVFTHSLPSSEFFGVSNGESEKEEVVSRYCRRCSVPSVI